MTPSKITAQLLEKYLYDQCTDDEKKAVEEWYTSLKGNSSYLDSLPESERQKLQNTTFDNITSQVQKRPIARHDKTIEWRWFTGIAAAIVLAFGFYFLYQLPEKTVAEVGKHQKKAVENKVIEFINHQPRIVRHKLPDESIVWMHAGASISYPGEFAADSRRISFTGEAFFDISKDKTRPFSIQSGEIVIRVLGTSFNVKAPATKKVFQISVVTGSVEVRTLDRQKKDQLVVLKPQQEVFFETLSKKLTVSTIPVTGKKEIFQPVTVNFKDTPLNVVLEQLQKKFNVDMTLENSDMSKCLVNADFEQQSLPLIMEMLCITLDAKYTIIGTSIKLHGLPCE
jgi:transmembrane sensor